MTLETHILCDFSHDNFQVSTDTNKAILSPDGRYACVGSHDGSLFFWNTTNGVFESILKKKHTYDRNHNRNFIQIDFIFRTMVTSIAWQPEGKYVASCEKHRRVILWSD
jgi:WD40 repeat protein